MLMTSQSNESRRVGGKFNWLKQPRSQSYRNILNQLLADADIVIDGPRPWDIHVKNPDFFRRVLAGGSMALGESYVDCWWECEQLDQFIYKILRADLQSKVKSWKERLGIIHAKLVNKQSLNRAFQVGMQHYDKGNDLYQAMLEKRMIYSCGYWKNVDSLEDAQKAKLELICKKLDIRPGMQVLDIGCGWGGTARFIAKHYKANVVGITVSQEQARFARKKTAGLPVDIRIKDYRKLQGSFDRILSVGMFEHVGYKNYKLFMQTVRRLLHDNGLFLLHTIGGNRSTARIDPWIERYIFPNANLPSTHQISASFEGLFVMEDWHNFGPDYDKTLIQWFDRFNSHWPDLKKKYDKRFYRMWRYYLLSCAGSFRARFTQLWQIVLSPKGIYRSYQCPR